MYENEPYVRRRWPLYVEGCYGYDSHRQLTRGGLSAWLAGGRLTTPLHNKLACYETLYRALGLDGVFRMT